MNLTGTYTLIEGFAIAFFGIMAVQNLWHREERLRVILGGILAYWAVQHIFAAAMTADILENWMVWSRLVNTVDMTAEPTCCFLLIELCRPGWLTWKKVGVNLAPFVILGGVYIATGNEAWYIALLAFFILYGTGVFVATLYNIPRFNRFLREHYSYEENVNLSWVYYVLTTFFVLMFVYAACATYDTMVGDCIYIAGSVVSWAMICYFISRQESVLFELRSTEREKPADAGVQEAAAAPVDLEAAIREYFIKPQLYLRPQLKLGDMAEAVGTNRTYLSRYLNDTLKTTFYDYVNALRLQHAVVLIEKSDYSIQAIADIAGFNSYSTFRRTFIARYGVPPQEYKKNLK